jgi:hypothetical protein
MPSVADASVGVGGRSIMSETKAFRPTPVDHARVLVFVGGAYTVAYIGDPRREVVVSAAPTLEAEVAEKPPHP